jgi:hypothetical protein
MFVLSAITVNTTPDFYHPTATRRIAAISLIRLATIVRDQSVIEIGHWAQIHAVVRLSFGPPLDELDKGLTPFSSSDAFHLIFDSSSTRRIERDGASSCQGPTGRANLRPSV